MENKYFDKWAFKEALECMEKDPIGANFKFEQYLKKYPYDYSIVAYYASNLITLGNFEQAQTILNYLEIETRKDKQFMNQEKKVKQLRENIIFNKLRLYSYLNDYEKFYETFFSIPKEKRDKEYSMLPVYIEEKRHKLIINDKNKDTYIYNQIVNYNEELFFEHIKKHLADYNCDLENPNKNIFSPNFPINDVVKEVKKYIPSNKRLYTGFFENIYVFKYDGCGRDNNKLVDYFKVICFHDTCNMITIVPVGKIENMPSVDLNYMIKDAPNGKVKKESAIDKFNRKFKRG